MYPLNQFPQWQHLANISATAHDSGNMETISIITKIYSIGLYKPHPATSVTLSLIPDNH